MRPQHFYASIPEVASWSFCAPPALTTFNSEFHAACPGNSIVTLVITSRKGANDPFVAEKIRNAHAIFIAGGDQSNYVKYWTGNAVQKEIDAAVARGVPIGGISTGLAVHREFVFDSMLDAVTSPQALANPYDPHVTLTRDFLSIPVLKALSPIAIFRSASVWDDRSSFSRALCRTVGRRKRTESA
jgi:Peptidase family S51